MFGTGLGGNPMQESLEVTLWDVTCMEKGSSLSRGQIVPAPSEAEGLLPPRAEEPL